MPPSSLPTSTSSQIPSSQPSSPQRASSRRSVTASPTLTSTMEAETRVNGTPQATPRSDRLSIPKSKSKKKLLNFCGAQTFVTFIIGDNAQKFTVHKTLVEHYSSYFEKAFNSDSVEAQTRVMKFEGMEADSFGLIVNWLYTQNIFHPEGRDICLVDLAKLWSLAAHLKIPQLQNQIIKHIDETEAPTYIQDLSAEWKEYVAFGLGREQEGTLLFRKVMDDVLDLLNVITASSDRLDQILEGLFGEDEGPAPKIIKSLLMHCGPYLSQNSMRKNPREYFVDAE